MSLLLVLSMFAMATNPNHYELLGVAPSASADEIRRAFRSLARRHHPDTADGASSASTMADINRAWSVLSDPVKRFEYDRSLRVDDSSPKFSRKETDHSTPVERSVFHQPAKFPWRGILFFGVVAIVGVLFLHAVAKPSSPEIPDNLLVIGSCVQIDTEQFVKEVTCQNPHDGVVRELVAFDRDCPSDTMGYLDRQGMGIACVDSALATNKWETQGP